MAYMITNGPQPGIGTQLVQRIDGQPINGRGMYGWGRGMGAYVATPVYFATPAGQAGIRGLGCACGGCCQASDDRGLGYFDSGLDPSGWGWPEWLTVIGGGYALLSMASTTSRGVRAVRAYPQKRRQAEAKRLRERAKELERR